MIVSKRGRPFATSAIALQAIIINENEQFLLLSSPRRNEANEWQTVSGGLEAGVTHKTIILHKSTFLWQLRRAVQLYRLLKDEWVETAVLQPPLF